MSGLKNLTTSEVSDGIETMLRNKPSTLSTEKESDFTNLWVSLNSIVNSLVTAFSTFAPVMS